MKKGMGILAVLLCLLLTGCDTGFGYRMLNVDLTGQTLSLQLYPDGKNPVPIDNAETVYEQVKPWLADAAHTGRYGSMPGAVRLYFFTENQQSFRQQYLIFTREDLLYVSYNPLHTAQECYQLKTGAYEAVKALVEKSEKVQ